MHEQTPEQAAATWQGSLECVLEPIDRKRRHPEDDLLSALIHAHDGSDRLSQQELLLTVLILFGAGGETTGSHLPLALLTLFRHPEQLRLLLAQPELVPNAVEELLRFIPMGRPRFRGSPPLRST